MITCKHVGLCMYVLYESFIYADLYVSMLYFIFMHLKMRQVFVAFRYLLKQMTVILEMSASLKLELLSNQFIFKVKQNLLCLAENKPKDIWK